jgi:electron transfer flavoprotein beta subunit
VGEPRVIALCKVVPTRVTVDARTGQPTFDDRELTVSPADRAAASLARRLADEHSLALTVLTVAPVAADGALRELAASVNAMATRVELAGATALAPHRWLATHPSRTVARAITDEIDGATFVVAGDHSLDRGSGTVPARVAARLRVAQLLGLVDVDVSSSLVTRRLPRGWREELALPSRAVLSVESQLGAPPRASLATLRATQINVVFSTHAVSDESLTFAPYRAPTRVVAAPDPHERAARRAITVIGALQPTRRREVLVATPVVAAQTILDRLTQWGYR